MKITKYQVTFSLIIMLATLCGRVVAQSDPKEFESFRDFMDRTTTVRSGEYLGLAGSRVQNSDAVEEMRLHILNMYRDIEVTHSFVLDSGYFDCIPVDQQPALRLHNIKSIATPPPPHSLLAKPAGAGGSATAVKPALQLDPGKPFDRFGNSVQCEEHTFPMRRITLETLTRFSSLQNFFTKQSSIPTKGLAPQAITDGHKYSITEQKVNNLGGSSRINVWSPYVNTTLGQVFSLTQAWYMGGIGAGTQSEEVGWVVYPTMFNGSEKPHLFIYSTADNYKTNLGCWNNSCGNFVQTSRAAILGGILNSSTPGGTQYEVQAQYYLYQGNWWVAINGNWIGYYPGSLYHGGQNTKFAQLMQFGTESVGTSSWPGEGSGRYSNAGYGYAGYQRDLWYYNTSGTSVWDNLGPRPLSPCYTITGPYSSTTSGWARYFYAGGPGGYGC